LKECNPKLLDDINYIKRALISAANETGATIVGESFHKFDPVGVTGIIAIAESHICIHTWPEYGYAAVDIFSCGTDFNPRDAVGLIVQRLECAQSSITEFQRGVMPELTTSSV
jgi:S-adenosylmethionine decarboxylase